MSSKKDDRNEVARIEGLAKAIEDKVASLGGTQLHPDLAQLLTDYGDALLSKEENDLSDLLFPGRSLKESEHDEKNDGDDEDEQDDLQIAWECLEQARLCLELASPGIEIDERSAFIYTRLGDLLSFQGNFVSAIEEYRNALALIEKFPVTNEREKSGILVPYGQVLLNEKRYVEAKKAFDEAIRLLGSLASRESEEKRVSLLNSVEEIKVFVEECEKEISMEKDCKEFFPKSVEKVQDGFGKPQLEPTNVLTISVKKTSEEREGNNEKKKIRRDA